MDFFRDELASFIRNRRGAVTPDRVGLQSTGQRRTPGLRREEVAHLAGVGLTWYTWLEQGREVKLTGPALGRVVKVLHLTDEERLYVSLLTRENADTTYVSKKSDEVSSALHGVVNSFPTPAYIRTSRWDIVSYNNAAIEMFGDLSSLPPEERNILVLVFLSANFRNVIMSWAEVARRSVARFRIDLAQSGGAQEYQDVINLLMRRSPEFRKFWSMQEVFTAESIGFNQMVRPDGTKVTYVQNVFLVDGGSRLRLITFTPTDPQNS